MAKENSNSIHLDDSAATEPPISDPLRDFCNALPDPIYMFDGEGVLTSANNSGALLQGRSADWLKGKRCCEMFWRVEGSENCVVERALATGQRVEVELLAGVEERPTLVIVQPEPGSHQTRRGAIVIARDIAELRSAEAEALAQRSFMASIADRSPEEIYALDTSGRITWMNERRETDDSSMLSGRYLIEFVAEDSRELANEQLQRALAGADAEFEMRAVRTDGTVREMEAHTSPLWKDNEVSGILVFLRDVTNRRRHQELQAQSDKLRAVGELAAGVAHNLNNSLTVIQGRAQLLMMRTSDEAVAKSLKIITSAVEEGAQTLRRILEFARRDSAKEFRPVDISDLLTSSIEIAKPKWQNKSVTSAIEVKTECNAPVYVMGELAELREVVLNLIFNAVDAMPDGGQIEIGTRSEIDSGCFWVADTGCGMPPETAARIFEPFFTTKGKSGTGLGLSASHGIITRHNGEILMVSEPGEGTRFEVRLPLCEKTERYIKSSPSSEELTGVNESVLTTK
ncbi:MAG TPA: PAS domain-containing protein [Pyrinomonadaceae bacterium]|nr:PAS domain-containing protein [Pyrinomonadaceae bacterium]